MKKFLAAGMLALSLSACVSNPERGIFSMSQYMQFVVNGVVTWEYVIPSGGMSCETNVWQNNKEQEGKLGYYKCSSSPAPAADLPFSYVEQFTPLSTQGYRSSSPATVRVKTSAACWSEIARLKTRDRVLISEACGPKPSR
jgi:hypothetical protein